MLLRILHNVWSIFRLFFKIFFKNRVCDEEGYIMFVRKNALQVLIPKYGLEGTVYLSDKKDSQGMFQFDDEVCKITYID